MSEMFNLGFGPDSPSPTEVGTVSSQVAIQTGTMKGLQQAGTAAASQAMAQPMTLADQIVGSLVEPANNQLGNVQALQTAIQAAGQQNALNAIQAPLATGLSMGYVSQGTPLLATNKRTSKRSRKTPAASSGAEAAGTAEVGQSGAQPQPLIAAPAAGGGPSATAPAAAPIQKPLPGQLVQIAPPQPCGYYAILGQLWLLDGSTTGQIGTITDARPGVSYMPVLPGGATSTASIVGYYPTLAAAQAANPSYGVIGQGVDCPSSVPAAPAAPVAAVPPLAPLAPPPSVVPLAPPTPTLPGAGIVPISPPVSPPPCPPSAINLTIPPCPPNLIYIFTPPCPQCGAAQALVPYPLPQGGPAALPPTINLTVPPCPKCQAPQQTINISTPVDISLSLPPGPPGGAPTPTGATPPASGPAPSQGQPGGACPTCSIAWLSLNYPQFVVAERAGRKTDYDILVDAIALGLCCLDLPMMPTCSMPLLMREVPDFVRAAKAQGLSDDQVLQAAVNIGLCADTQVSSGLGEEAVGYIAPGSALQLEAEFDPSAAGERSALGDFIEGLTSGLTAVPLAGLVSSVLAAPGQGDVTACPLPFFRIGQPNTQALTSLPEVTQCLGGMAAPVAGVVKILTDLVGHECNADTGSLSQALCGISAQLLEENSIWSRFTGFFLRLAISFLRTGACLEVDLAAEFKALTGCDAELAVIAFAAQGFASLIQKYTDLIPRPILDAINRLAEYACASRPPSAAEANALAARGWIDRPTWECMVRAEGMEPKYQRLIVDATGNRASPEQVLILERKGVLGGSALEAAYQHNGFISDTELAYWKKANEWLASPSDAIDWMIKDVADPQIVQTFLTDAEFTQKYAGHVKEVFEWNGISKEDANNIWRAHWRNMAPHELYQLHKRLRPGWTARFSDQQCLDLANAICPQQPSIVTPEMLADRPQSNGWPVPTYCSDLEGPVGARSWLESLVTSGYHVSEALGQADFPPFWRQRLLALSYNALNRTDLRTAYVQGSLSPDRLLSGLQDIGYFIDDALALQRQDTFQAILRFSKDTSCTQYVYYGGDPVLLQLTLQAEGMANWMWPYVFFLVSLRRAGRQQILFLRSIQSQFMRGLLNEAAALQALQNYQHPTITPPPSLAGFPALAQLPFKIADDVLSALVKEWSLLKSTKPKQESASQICNDFKTGLITGRHALNLLVGLGYTKRAATRILSICYLRTLPKTLQTAPKPGTADYEAMQDALNS